VLQLPMTQVSLASELLHSVYFRLRRVPEWSMERLALRYHEEPLKG
jgi:hypothetical protein